MASTIQERFQLFDVAHPDVFRHFRNFALELWTAGRRRYSADAILHRIRWHYAVSSQATDKEPFKLNDHYSSRYARKLMEQDSRFTDFFQLRRLQRN